VGRGAITQVIEEREVTRSALAARAVQAGGAARRVPLATYRLQFNRAFRFRDATACIPYLHQLGVTDIYASPYLKARPESSHGYDITDHGRLNPGIGSERDYRRLVTALHRRGMGQVLDIVPNHMGISSANPWWMDVLENGPAARHAETFDIDWQPLKPELRGRLLLPILGDQYGKVLERGELTLEYRDGAFYIRYWNHLLPVDPHTYPELLRFRLEALVARLGPQHPAVLELQSIITAAGNLPERTETSPEQVEERAREKEIIKRRLAALCAYSPEVRAAIRETVRAYNGRPGDPHSFDLLDALLDRQAYRLSFWRVAAEEINYRRFFDINDLAAIRVERPRVFHESHALILELIGRGAVTGLRVDHIDGLREPAAYTLHLQAAALVARLGPDVPDEQREEVEQAVAERLHARLQEAPEAPEARPLWVVVEKILEPGERLPELWPVSGTTGYDFLNAVNGLFVDAGNRRAFDDIYARFTGLREGFRDVAYACKRLIMATSMASELNVLGHQLSRLAQRNRRTRDFTVNSLTDALREVIACFPVYRTYITGMDERVGEQDRSRIEVAVARARRRNPATDPSVFDFVRDTLLLVPFEGDTDEDRQARRDFVLKFQQYTGPVMAKGVEDTAFYRYNRLVSLNEVGGEPEQFGVSVAAFHRQNAERQRRWPEAMITTATHDTKRGEDVRARINVLSELPREWRSALTRWRRINRRRKPLVDGVPVPDANEEYLLYQTLLGAWPAEPMTAAEKEAFIRRIQAYMLKAAKEAKVNTSWINPNAPYDEAIQAFVAAILSGGEDDPFLRDFLPFQRRVARAGAVNSLAQVVLKLASPGVPDIYQGTELWDLSLVDPDNRRPVDFARRRAALAEVLRVPERGRSELARALLAAWPDGRVKLYVTHRALTLRRARPELFRAGAYLPLEADGPRADHVVAFARTLDEAGGAVGSAPARGGLVIVAVPRLVARLIREPDGFPLGEPVWADTWLAVPGEPGARFRDRFTGAELESVARDGRAVLPLSALFGCFPVALLERVDVGAGGRAGAAR
jgi:(1->4)-alpha-D-glucan 1-alpha-D-glucosylmutase